MKKHDMTAKQLHNAFVDKHNKTPDDWINEGTLHFWYHGSKSKKENRGGFNQMVLHVQMNQEKLKHLNVLVVED